MFGTVFILHILQKALLVLGSIECLILRIDIHSIVPLSKRSQHPERIEDICRNAKHARRRNHFKVIFGQLLSSQLHGEEQVSLSWSGFLSQSSHHTIDVIEHIIIHCDNVMQCDSMSVQHPQGPISEWPQHFHDILQNGPFILSCEEWPIIAVFWVFKPLVWEFTKSEGALAQLLCRVPMGLHIHNRMYRDVDFGFLPVNELISMTRWQHDQ